MSCEVEGLMFVVENRFDYKGRTPSYRLGYHYKVIATGRIAVSRTLDEGKYECEWIDLRTIREYDIRLSVPNKELLFETLNKTGEIGLGNNYFKLTRPEASEGFPAFVSNCLLCSWL